VKEWKEDGEEETLKKGGRRESNEADRKSWSCHLVLAPLLGTLANAKTNHFHPTP
jgi:hypothetical protein